jgi:hypothetical protein
MDFVTSEPLKWKLGLDHLPLARSSCQKVQNVMSLLFSHASEGRELGIDKRFGGRRFERKGHKGRQIYVLLHSFWFSPFRTKSFRIYGRDDGARTRDLCRDR